VYLAARSNDEEVLQVLIKKLKLVTVLIDHYRKDGSNTNNQGYILNIFNVLRLQAGTQSPDSFLRGYLKSHDVWRKFLPDLIETTTSMQTRGLGFNVPKAMRFASDMWGDNANDTTNTVEGIDYGSAFAQELGFVDDIAWPEETDEHKKKHKKKKKKKSKASKGNSDANGDASTEDAMNTSIESIEESSESNGNGDTPSKKKRRKKKKKSKSSSSETESDKSAIDVEQ